MLLHAKILGRRTRWCAKVAGCALLPLAACQPADTSSSTTEAHQAAICQPSNRDCALARAQELAIDGRWWIESDKIRAEQPLRFTVTLDSDVQIEQASATVRGVKMNMGILPLFIDQISGNQLHGRLLLPACSSNMLWRAEFQISTTTGSTVLSQEFYAER